MTDTLADLPVHTRKRLATALATGAIPLDASPIALRAATGITDQAAEVAAALTELRAYGLDNRAAAEWLRALDRVIARERKPDLVWSGPTVPGVHARDTRQVVNELIRGAQHSIWLSSFVYFDGPRAFAPLAERMAAQPDLQVRLLLNIQRPWGDTSAANALVMRFAQRFWTTDWPGATRPEVFYAPSSLEPSGSKGALHAKVIVVDDERLFVTSANLTEAALDRNIEAGILLQDSGMASSMVRHLSRLIQQEVLLGVPHV